MDRTAYEQLDQIYLWLRDLHYKQFPELYEEEQEEKPKKEKKKGGTL